MHLRGSKQSVKAPEENISVDLKRLQIFYLRPVHRFNGLLLNGNFKQKYLWEGWRRLTKKIGEETGWKAWTECVTAFARKGK